MGFKPIKLFSRYFIMEIDCLLSTTYDEQKWARATAAVKDVMQLGIYSLFVAPYKSSGTIYNPFPL